MVQLRLCSRCVLVLPHIGQQTMHGAGTRCAIRAVRHAPDRAIWACSRWASACIRLTKLTGLWRLGRANNSVFLPL